MSWSATVVSAYRFHMFAQARQLDQRGLLDRLLTAMPRASVSEVPRDRVRTRPKWAALRHALRRFPIIPDARLVRSVISDFDHWAARQYPFSPIVSCLSSFGSRTLAVAREHGSVTICDRGSWHITQQLELIRTEHESWGAPPPVIDPWIVDRELSDYATAHAVMVPSRYAAESFLRQGHSSDRVVVVPYGTSLDRFAPASVRPPSFRAVCVGRIEFQKGHQYLLEAASLIGIRKEELEFIGPIEPVFARRFARDLDSVTVAGPVPRTEIPNRLRAATVFVLASVQEGLALSVLEAMASGLAVIATRETGAGEFIDDGTTGLLVPARDPEALAAAIARLRAEPDLAYTIGAAGARRAVQAASWDAYGDRLVKAYETILSKS